MRSELRRTILEDAVDLIIDHRGKTPKKLGGDFSSNGVQVVSAKNVFGGRLHLDVTQRFVSAEIAERWMPVKLAPGDVLLTSEAPLGECAYVKQVGDVCLGQRLFALRARSGVAVGRFLYYALRSPQVQRRLQARATGTTAQRIKQSELRHVELDLPSLGEQERVVSVLGTLDDKIDSNRRIAALLDETANTLFRSRFVEFLGVDEFEESEIGPIPRGWGLGVVADMCAAVRNGGTPKRMESAYWEDGTIPWFKTGELTESFLPIESKVQITERGLAESNCQILPRGTVLVAIYAAPTVGRLGILDAQGTCNQACTALIPRAEVGFPFVFLTLRGLREHFNSLASGSAQQNISKAIVQSARVLLPPTSVLDDFNEVALHQFEWIARLRRETRALAAIARTLAAEAHLR